MIPSDPLASTFAFGEFELDWPSRELRRRGKRLRVTQQPLHALVLLVNGGGTVVTREELRRALWQDGTFVDFDRAINKTINKLRQLLGDHVERPRFIQTVPKCGYRFVAPVARASPHPTQNPQVGEALVKARHLWNKRTGEGVVGVSSTSARRSSRMRRAWMPGPGSRSLEPRSECLASNHRTTHFAQRALPPNARSR
jgi:DNA-binding winged helix-turn-helix (wHTH) protein